ncbi:ABC transporter permease [Paenibacillus brevis]|nr:ABC transporter permease subunit [Paenibacillus brevis]
MKTGLILSLALVGSILLLALFGSHLAPHDPYKTNLALAQLSPSWEHPFGTDHLGRCVFSRILSGASVSIFSALVVVLVAAAFGTAIGVISGYVGGIVDALLMRITTIFQAFPYFLLAVAVAGTLGIGLMNGMISLAVVFWTSYARLGRSLVLGIKNENYIKASRLCGAGNHHIVLKYMLPNIGSPILITGVLDISAVILSMAGLSFLGLGAQRPTAEWGAMMSEARNYLQTAPWVVIFTGFALFVVVVCFNYLGDTLRGLLDRKATGK